MRVINQTFPRIIVLETAVGFSAGYDALRAFVAALEGYRLEKELTYEFHLNAPSINLAASRNCRRVLSIFRKERPAFSLSEATLARLLTELEPSAQAESLSRLNLGFGFLYYGVVRVFRPKLALVLGSRKGFSAVCIALAIRDNGNGGKVILVDAAYDDEKDGVALGHGGVGFWRDREKVTELLDAFGVRGLMDVRVMRTSEFARQHRAEGMPPADVLLIDADHSYAGFKEDFETYKDLVRHDGLILCHDTEVQEGLRGRRFGIAKYFGQVARRRRQYQAVSLPVWPGLGIVRRAGPVRGVPTDEPSAGSRISTAATWAYRRIPMPGALRGRLKDVAYRICGLLKPGCRPYRRYLASRNIKRSE